MILTGENELKGKVALPHLLPKCISTMLRMLALQVYSRRSATRNNIETSVVEVRGTVQCVAVVRGSRQVSVDAECHEEVLNRCNKCNYFTARCQPYAICSHRPTRKYTEHCYQQHSYCIRKYSVRNSGCSNALGQSENIGNNGAWYMVYQERRWRQFCDRNTYIYTYTFRGSPGMASPVLQSDKQT